MGYLKIYDTHSQYLTYIGSTSFVKPNVSYCIDNKEMHYNPWYDPVRFVTKFNVTTTTSSTSLFNNPTLLSEIEIDGVVQPSVVNNYTFNTTGIHTVKYTLVDGTTFIDGGSFGGKSNMINITIPDTINGIYAGAFAGCSSLTSITIPNSVTTIGGTSPSGTIGTPFGGSGIKRIKIPSFVTTIGEGAFGGLDFNFEDVIFESINPNATFVVDTTNKCITNIDGTILLAAFNNTVAIPNTVTSIGMYAFSGCSGLTSITIPNTVTSIGMYAFTSCSGLTSITIPNTVTSIGMYAFSDCTGLTSITIPNSVTTIGQSVFSGCTGLTSITSLATTAPTIQSDTFKNVNTGGTLYVLSGSTGYDTWMGTGNYYLGKYSWTKVEQ